MLNNKMYDNTDKSCNKMKDFQNSFFVIVDLLHCLLILIQFGMLTSLNFSLFYPFFNVTILNLVPFDFFFYLVYVVYLVLLILFF